MFILMLTAQLGAAIAHESGRVLAATLAAGVALIIGFVALTSASPLLTSDTDCIAAYGGPSYTIANLSSQPATLAIADASGYSESATILPGQATAFDLADGGTNDYTIDLTAAGQQLGGFTMHVEAGDACLTIIRPIGVVK